MQTQPGRWSLRSRLLLIALVCAITSWVAGSAAMYWSAAQQDEAVFDARLRELAAMVNSFADDEIREMIAERRTDRVHSESVITAGTRYQYQVWSDDGELLLHSANASPDAPLMPLQTTGFLTTHRGGEYRVFATRSVTSATQIQVAEHVDARGQVVATFGGLFFAFVMLSLGLVGLLSWWLVHVALRSVDATAAQLNQRSPGDLTELHDEDPPSELVPMIDSVNRLMRRIERTLAGQRQFVSVAAHEMRTPLAGLRAHAQVAHAARDEAERSTALAEVMRGVDRTAHLLDQLLDLAHVDSLAGDDGIVAQMHDTVRLADVASAVMADLAPFAAQRGMQLQTRFDAATVPGNEFGIAMLMRNLLRNAFIYAPEGATVSMTSAPDADGVILTIDDAGPSIPVHERELVFERFYRAKGQPVSGVGLGLSIVHSVASAHQAKLWLLDSPLGGLRVQVHFPGRRATLDALPAPPSSRGFVARPGPHSSGDFQKLPETPTRRKKT